ncbi:DHHC palmitoyltransferase-domain-containing protein [Kalaharituber pfeilii]|nr:DHHC palmitoyltransferase-domain-containing protein [Kalaharituber pfeilii]
MGAVSPHTINRWVAHFMPLVIIGALGYASWVFCALICVDYLVKHRNIRGTAAGLLAAYAVLLLLLLTSYIRVVWVINFDPGLVPGGVGGGPAEKERVELDSEAILDSVAKEREKQQTGRNDEHGRRRPSDTGSQRGRGLISRSSHGGRHESVADDIPLESGDRLRAVPYASTIPASHRTVSRTPSPLPDTAPPPSPPSQLPQAHLNSSSWSSQNRSRNGYLEMPPPLRGQPPPTDYSISRPQSLAQWMLPKNLHEFYNMDAFICENDGLPRWCYHCNCWKPDRSHHCGELGRCVRKMDHFCPWVGGVVGETSFKYFYQTVCYGVLYCAYLLIVTAVMIHDRGTKGYSIPSTWVVLLVLTCFFGLFCAGMTTTTTKFILRNTTTIDNISAASKVYQIAIYDPYTSGTSNDTGSCDSPYTSTVTEDGMTNMPSRRERSNFSGKRITFPDADPAMLSIGAVPRRTFVIAKTEPGENPWCLESRMENFKEVMGYRLWEWWLPITDSPSTIRTSGGDSENGSFVRGGMYKFNPVLMDRLRREFGVGIPVDKPRSG